MIPTFEEVHELTKTRIDQVAFEPIEAEAYYNAILSMPRDYSTLIEIGLQYGRSSSIPLQLQPHLKFRYIAIDPFIQVDHNDHTNAAAEWLRMWAKLEPRPQVELKLCKSGDLRLPNSNLMLVDGDHSEIGIQTDINQVFDSVFNRGLALFHDYGRSSLPQIKRTVDGMLSRQLWDLEGVYGTLAIFRRKG